MEDHGCRSNTSAAALQASLVNVFVVGWAGVSWDSVMRRQGIVKDMLNGQTWAGVLCCHQTCMKVPAVNHKTEKDRELTT